MNNTSSERLNKIRYETFAETARGANASVEVNASLLVAVLDELLALREAQPSIHPVNDDMALAFCHAISDSSVGSDELEDVKTGLRAALANYAAPQLPAVPEYPELLPCPVLLEPGLRLGKGVKTRLLLDALSRRAEYYAGLESMTPEERAEHDAGIAEFKSLMGGSEQRLASAVELLKEAAPHMLTDESLKDPDGALCGKVRAVPDELTIDGSTEKLTVEYSLSNTGVTAFRDGWNACRAAMIGAAPKPEA